MDNPHISLSSDDLAGMIGEVDEDLQDSENDSSDESEKDYGRDFDEDEEDMDVCDTTETTSKKRKRDETNEYSDHQLLIGNTLDANSPENESLSSKFRRGEHIPQVLNHSPVLFLVVY